MVNDSRTCVHDPNRDGTGGIVKVMARFCRYREGGAMNVAAP